MKNTFETFYNALPMHKSEMLKNLNLQKKTRDWILEHLTHCVREGAEGLIEAIKPLSWRSPSFPRFLEDRMDRAFDRGKREWMWSSELQLRHHIAKPIILDAVHAGILGAEIVPEKAGNGSDAMKLRFLACGIALDVAPLVRKKARDHYPHLPADVIDRVVYQMVTAFPQGGYARISEVLQAAGRLFYRESVDLGYRRMEGSWIPLAEFKDIGAASPLERMTSGFANTEQNRRKLAKHILTLVKHPRGGRSQKSALRMAYVVLARGEGLTFREIAKALRISTESAKQYAKRFRKLATQ